MQDKLQRLAAQFDKELTSRDNQLKTFKSSSQEDIQRSFQALYADIEMNRKLLNEMEVRKADDKDLLDLNQKLHISLDQKIDK